MMISTLGFQEQLPGERVKGFPQEESSEAAWVELVSVNRVISKLYLNYRVTKNLASLSRAP